MNSRLRFSITVWAVHLCLIVTSPSRLQAASLIGPQAWLMPQDVANANNNPVEGDWLNLGWQTFLALNWPAQSGGIGGQPNTHASITAPTATPYTTVWQTYLSKDQVFLENGANPGTWDHPTHARPTTNKGLPILGGFAKAVSSASISDDTFEEAFIDWPLIDQQTNYVLFEIRLNQSEFTYLSQTGYYDAARQIAAFPTNGTPTFVPMPTNAPALPVWAQQGALEIKAAWRILVPGTDTFSRYFQMPGYYETPDGKVLGPVTFGLVGFHILRLTPSTGSTWYWATFEQVDNVDGPRPSFNPGGGVSYPPYGFQGEPTRITSGKPLPANPPVGVSRPTPIGLEVQQTNQIYQAALAGTPWQYYQLIQVQFPVSGPNPPATVPISSAGTNTRDMRNVTMETYAYKINKPNCTDCHGQFGFPQMTDAAKSLYQTNGDYQIFTFLLGDAQMSAGERR